MKANAKQSHVAFQFKHGRPLVACCYDPKGRYLFTSSEDYTLQRWELPSGKKTAWAAHDSWVRDIVFLPDGETMISGGCDDKVIYWPTAAKTMKPIRTVEAHKGWIRSMSVSKDGKWLATGGNDNLVKLWDTSNGKLIRTFTGHTLDVYSTLLHPNGKYLLSGDQGGQIHQWEISSGKLLRKFDGKALLRTGTQGIRYGGARGLALSPDGKYLAACGLHKASNPLGAVNEPLVLQFEWKSGKKVRSHVANKIKGIGWQVEYLTDGSILCASGGSGGAYLLFWKTNSDKEYHRLKLPSTARDMHVHPNGLEVATAHHDGQVRVTRFTPKPKAKAKPKKKK